MPDSDIEKIKKLIEGQNKSTWRSQTGALATIFVLMASGFVTAAITWGSIQERMVTHERRIEAIERKVNKQQDQLMTIREYRAGEKVTLAAIQRTLEVVNQRLDNAQ